GHGAGVFSALAQELGAPCFGVYSASEAYELKQHLKVGATIYIMGDVDGPALEWAVEHGIAFNVFERNRLSQAIHAAKAVGKPGLLLLEVATGMHRVGFRLAELSPVMEVCRVYPHALKLVCICSHLSGAESQAKCLRYDM